MGHATLPPDCLALTQPTKRQGTRALLANRSRYEQLLSPTANNSFTRDVCRHSGGIQFNEALIVATRVPLKVWPDSSTAHAQRDLIVVEMQFNIQKTALAALYRLEKAASSETIRVAAAAAVQECRSLSPKSIFTTRNKSPNSTVK